ncbi:MAG: hypothetical protein ACRDKA_00145, partial [Actinomycetota bacterium]
MSALEWEVREMRKGRIARSIGVVFALGLLWPLMAALPAQAATCGDGSNELALEDSAGWTW